MSTMVDSKIGKSFSKSVGRAKEKILQNLGKVDRTADEIFDEHVSNFSKQQCAASRLQKELNNYIRCVRACSTANHALLEAVSEIYEPEWGGKELLTVNSQSCEMLWNDFAHRLAEQVLIPLNTYQGQFPEMRKKIEKRGRKLVDFDGERHALQALQSNPRRAEAKLARQRENLEAAKRTYEVLNLELHEELPALYGSRIVFLVSAMSTLFASENIFHSETSKVYTDLENIVERLAKESAKGNLNFKSSNAILNNTADSPKDDNKGEGSSPDSPTVKSSDQVVAELSRKTSTASSSSPPPSHETTPTPPINNTTHAKSYNNHEDSFEGDNVQIIKAGLTNGITTTTTTTDTTDTTTTDTTTIETSSTDESQSKTPPPKLEKLVNGDADHAHAHVAETSIPHGVNGIHNNVEEEKKKGDKTNMSLELKPTNPSNFSGSVNSPVTSSKEEPGVLYRVRATYRYLKEDVDELSFEAGEIIRVVEYDDPEEQEEGWLMGVKDNGDKGMFPANFTRPL